MDEKLNKKCSWKQTTRLRPTITNMSGKNIQPSEIFEHKPVELPYYCRVFMLCIAWITTIIG